MTKQLLLFPEVRRHTHGIGYVTQWLYDLTTPNEELYEWIEKRRLRYAGHQLAFLDAITDCYLPVFRQLPVGAQKVVLEICNSYRKGVNFVTLSHVSCMDMRAVASQTSRLVKGDIITRVERGRYAVPYWDMLCYHAMRHDLRFRRFPQDGDQSNLVTRFIESIEAGIT